VRFLVRALKWLNAQRFVAGLLVGVSSLSFGFLLLPGSWVAQYGVRRSVIEDGVLLAAQYMAPALGQAWSIEAAPVAAARPSPAPTAAPARRRK
jgi:hypothetical protein